MIRELPSGIRMMVERLAKMTKKLFERIDNHDILSSRFTVEKIDYLSHCWIEWANIFLLKGKIELHGRSVQSTKNCLSLGASASITK